MKKPELDLSKENCHVCGSPLVRNMKAKTEKCIHFMCQIKNVTFDIPFKQEKKSAQNTKARN